jgi:hypothetical protein
LGGINVGLISWPAKVCMKHSLATHTQLAMVSGEADRSISVVVHALPLLNISDFYIRSQLARSNSPCTFRQMTR